MRAYNRFIDNEKWRKEFKVDDLVRNFEYTEKPKVFEYYPQYYHKTDKVRLRVRSFDALQLSPETCRRVLLTLHKLLLTFLNRMAVLYTSNSLEKSI